MTFGISEALEGFRLLGEPTENPTIPPPPCPAGTPPAAPGLGEDTLSDGILDQPPPDLTGINAGFNIAAEIDIESHILLDILSDKPLAPQQKNSPPLHVPRAEVPVVVTPQASEWEIW